MRLIEHTPKRWADRLRVQRPIAESIIQLDPRGNKRWRSFDDDEFVAYANWTIKNESINGTRQLAIAHPGLYDSLLRRERATPGIAARIGLENRRHDWKRLDDDDFVGYVKEFMRGKGIGLMRELEQAHPAVYSAILRRKRITPGIMGSIGFDKKKSSYASMDHCSFVSFIKAFMSERGISRRTELSIANPRLYEALYRRERVCPGIMGSIGFEERKKKWEVMSDGEIVARVKRLMRELGINGRKELEKADRRVYYALLERERKSPGVIAETGLQRKKPKERDWKSKGDEELVAHTQRFMAVRGISGRKELQNADAKLYDALLRRERKRTGIMGRVGFGRKRREQRDWKAMDDNEFVLHIRAFIKERGVVGKSELGEADRGLYCALLRREKKNPGLMRKAFEEAEFSKLSDAVDGVLSALDSFGEEEKEKG